MAYFCSHVGHVIVKLYLFDFKKINITNRDEFLKNPTQCLCFKMKELKPNDVQIILVDTKRMSPTHSHSKWSKRWEQSWALTISAQVDVNLLTDSFLLSINKCSVAHTIHQGLLSTNHKREIHCIAIYSGKCHLQQGIFIFYAFFAFGVWKMC